MSVLESQSHLESQLAELESYRRELNTLYMQKESELEQARTSVLQLRAEAEHSRAQHDVVLAENDSLRTWNTQLAEQLALYQAELLRLVTGLEVTTLGKARGLEPAAEAREELALDGAADEVGRRLGQQRQGLTAAQAGIKLARTQVELAQAHADLKAAQDALTLLQSNAHALSADFGAATRQIGKLEDRLRDNARALDDRSAEIASLEARLEASHRAQSELTVSLERSEGQRSQTEAERDELYDGPLAAAEQRYRECAERERQIRVVLERQERAATTAAPTARWRSLGRSPRRRCSSRRPGAPLGRCARWRFVSHPATWFLGPSHRCHVVPCVQT